MRLEIRRRNILETLGAIQKKTRQEQNQWKADEIIDIMKRQQAMTRYGTKYWILHKSSENLQANKRGMAQQKCAELEGICITDRYI